MKQCLHIFAKDLRRMWAEILVSLTLTVALVRVYPQQWLSWVANGDNMSFSPRAYSVALWAVVLMILVPVSWWILISAVIHEERLVGHRQFWLTRPYQWPSLMAAKALFVFAFVYVPFFLAQCSLLVSSGFQPFSYLSGLLYNLLLMTGMLILPMAALAVVTPNFPRLTLVTLGVILCLVGIDDLASLFPGTRISAPFGDHLCLVLLIAGCIAVITVQYATRRAGFAWLLLITVLLLIAIVACTAPDQALMDQRYPASSSQVVQFEYRKEPSAEPSLFVAKPPSQIGVSIPIYESGVDPGSIVIPEDLKVSLQSPDGSHWTSVWQPIYMDQFLPGARMARASFTMPRSVYNKFKSIPLHAHITFAISRAQEDETTRMAIGLSDFSVPGFGACTPLTGVAQLPDEIGGIACRTAIWKPPLTLIQVEWSYDDCHKIAPGERQSIQGGAWIGSLDKAPADFGMIPVWNAPIGLSNRQPNYQVKEPQHMCPGAPVTFTTYKFAGRSEVSIDIQQFMLPGLNRGQMKVIENP